MKITVRHKVAILLLIVLGGAATLGAGVLLRGRLMKAELERARAEGLRLTAESRFAEGLETLNPYVSRIKDDREVLLAFARCRLAVPLPNNRHIEAAIAVARLATQTAPEDTESFEMLAELYSVAGMYTETIATCDRLLAFDPTNESAMEWRTSALIALDRTQDAIASADAFLDIMPKSVRAHAAKAQALRENGQSASAVVEYLQAPALAALLEHDPAYHLLLAEKALEVAPWNIRKGIPLDTEAVRSANETARHAVQRIASMPLRQPEPTGASDSAVHQASLAADATAMIRLVAFCIDDPSLFGVADLAADRYADELPPALRNEFILIESRRAWWQLRDDRFQELARRLDPGAHGSTPDPAVLGWLLFTGIASQFDAQSEPDATIANQLAKVKGEHAAFWREIAAAADAAENGATTGEVLAVLDNASDLIPKGIGTDDADEKRALVAARRVRAFMESNQPDSARLEIESIIAPRRTGLLEREARFLQRARAYFDLASLLVRDGEQVGAKSILNSLRSLGVPSERTSQIDLETIEKTLLGQGSMSPPDAAARLLPTARANAEKDPSDPDKLAFLARVLFIAGQRDEASEAVESMLRLPPPLRIEDLVEVARFLFLSNDPAADALLEHAQNARPGSVPILAARADFAANRGDTDAGLSILNDAIEQQPTTDEGLAVVRADFMDRFAMPGVLAALQKLSDDFPDSPNAQSTVIESKAAWQDESVVRQAIARLRAATAESGVEWKIGAIRADLAFLDGFPEDARAGVLSETLLDLRSLSDRFPRDAKLHWYISVAYDRAGSVEEAARSLTAAARIDPAYYNQLVLYLRSKNRAADALRALDAFAAIPASQIAPLVVRHRANLLEQFGLVNASISDRQHLRARLGQLADFNALGEAHARTGNTEKAEKIARKIAEAETSPQAAYAASRLFAQIGLFDDAVATYLNARSPEDGEASARTDIAMILLNWNQHARAVEQLNLAAEVTPQAATALREIQAVLLFHAHAASGEKGLAQSAINAIRAPDNRSLAALQAAAQRSDEPTAWMLCDLLASAEISPFPRSNDLATVLSDYLLNTTTRDELTDALASLSSDPDASTNELVWKARLALTTRSTEQASPYFGILQDAADRLAAREWPLRELAKLHIEARRFQDAEANAQRLAERTGDDTFESDFLRAEIMFASGDTARALSWLIPHKERIAEGRAGIDTAGMLATSLAAAGRGDEAEEIADRLARTDPAAMLILFGAVRALPPREIDRARAWLRRVDDLVGPSDTPSDTTFDTTFDRGLAWANLAARSERAEDAQTALGLLEPLETRQVPPGAWRQIQAIIAETLVIAGRPEAGVAIFEDLIKANPDDAPILNNYAFVLAARLDRAADALPLANNAVELASSPDAPPAMIATFEHTLAIALRLTGDLPAAEETLRTALERAPRSPDVVLELAEVLLEREEPEQSSELLRRLPPDDTLNPSMIERAGRLRAKIRAAAETP